jgi:hypothetical protein
VAKVAQVTGRVLLWLWVVLSLGWIAAVGFHGYSVWPEEAGFSEVSRALAGGAPPPLPEGAAMHAARWFVVHIVRPHLKWAFAPPVGVLIIGMALWWGAAGFRK